MIVSPSSERFIDNGVANGMDTRKFVPDEEEIKSPETTSIFAETDPEVIESLLLDLEQQIQLINELLDDPNFVVDPQNTPEMQADRIVLKLLDRLLLPDHKISALYPQVVLQEIQLPYAVDWLPQKTQTRISELCEVLVEYYNSPIITDEHDINHKSRREDRDEVYNVLGTIVRAFLDKSKIRGNTNYAMYGLFHGISTMIGKTPDSDPRALKIKSLIDDLHAKFRYHGRDLYSYTTWPIEDKRALTSTINPAIQNFLSELLLIYQSS